MAETLSIAYQETPLGCLRISGTEAGISGITFLEETPADLTLEVPACLEPCYRQLTEFFRGERREFDLNLQPNGTGFQQKVWQQLKAIPFGKTQSYLEVALQLGESTYTRAVGNANGKNPLAIVVPCHRVIGANGALTGYAGGLWRKNGCCNLKELRGKPSFLDDL